MIKIFLWSVSLGVLTVTPVLKPDDPWRLEKQAVL